MNALTCCDDFSFEEKIIAYHLQVTVTLNDKQSKSSRIVFQKDFPIPLAILLAIFLAIIIIPILALLFVFGLIFWGLSFSKNDSSELTYEEAKEYLNSGKGYLNNLSDKDNNDLILKRDNAPLGL
ncbi:hypothetical protein [Methylovulum miyakonense]|uniref:hypothetical protein n=1 Tax=Methylovulum miyakonense TaxID=645578 RepID=UPI000361FFE5|nr:hypothetical protein [Methylovulum miyakonense]